MIPTHPKFLAAILFLALCPVVEAQDDLKAVLESSMKEQISGEMIDPSLSSPATSGKPQVTLSSSDKDSKAVAEIGYGLSDNWSVKLKVVAPIEKGQKEVELANLDGLTTGSSATLGFTRLFWRLEDQFIDAIGQVCEQHNSSLPAGGLPERSAILDGQCTPETLKSKGWPWDKKAEIAVSQALEITCREFNDEPGTPILFCDLDTLRARGGDWEGRAVKRMVAALTGICEEHNTRPAGFVDPRFGECTYLRLKSKGPQWAKRAREAAQAGTPKFLSLNLTAQTDSFAYLEGEELAEKKNSKDGYGVTLSIGGLRRSAYYGFNVLGQQYYKGEKKTEVCRPIEGTDALSCQDIALAAPSRIEKQILQLEARRFYGKRFGINPRLSYDLESDESSAQLVNYFLTDKEKGLNGGIDLAYKEGGADDGLSIRVFIGTTLSLTP